MVHLLLVLLWTNFVYNIRIKTVYSMPNFQICANLMYILVGLYIIKQNKNATGTFFSFNLFYKQFLLNHPEKHLFDVLINFHLKFLLFFNAFLEGEKSRI